MYVEVYKWFTETSGIGLAEQAGSLRNIAQVKKEDDVAEAIELWEEKLRRSACHGEGYQLTTAFKQVALKKILVGKIRETFDLWETEKYPFEDLLVKRRTSHGPAGLTRTQPVERQASRLER